MRHWSHDSIFYHIYPLGFCGALQRNNKFSLPVNRLEKLYGWIDHLKYLGVNSLYLGPLFESTYHGYDTIDYYRVDRRLGTNELLKDIVASLHQNGIRVVFDGVFNHVGRDFWAFQDVLQNRQNSRYCSWFSSLNFSSNNHFNDHFSYEGWNGHYELVKLNLHNQELREHLFNAVKMWIEYFEIDGLRLDAADCVDINFLKDLSRFVRKEKPDFWLMGEIIHGNYNIWANKDILDSVTNYECYKGLYSSHNDRNYFEIAYSLKRQSGTNGIYKDIALYTFADNHDVNRVASTLSDPSHLYPLYCLLFTIPGIPSIYYGSEWGVKGIKQNGSDYLLRPFLELSDREKMSNSDLQETISKLARIRCGSTALKYGSYRELHTDHQQLAFLRKSEDEIFIVLINSSERCVSQELNISIINESVLGQELRFCDILNNQKEYISEHNRLRVNSVPPNWACILKLKK